MRYEDASGTVQASGPIANDDAETLSAGQRGPATGNLITGEGTQYGSSGADSAAGGHVTTIAGKGGEDSSFSGGKLSVAGEHGRLTVDADGNYSYLANGNVENVRDRFTYTLADNQGNSDTAALIVEIGKTPAVIKANAQQIVPGPDGVVTLPPGVELSDVRVVGRNLVVDLPDGTQLIILDGAVFVPQLVVGGVEVPATNVAALLIGQEVQPAAGEIPPSGGGNFALPPPPLDPGIPLGDLIPPTEYDYVPPEPEEVLDTFNDEPEIVIQPDGQPASVNAVDSVDEKGLPTRNEGEPEGSGEEAAAGADGDPSEATAGTIIINSPDGVGSVMINDVLVTGVVGQEIEGEFGTLTITGFAGDNILYSYVLHDNTSGDDTQDDFEVVLTDEDGDTATATLTIDIIDDVPTARPDTDAVPSGSNGPATGNVMTDAAPGDAGDSDTNAADTVGADNAVVTFIDSVNNSAAGVAVPNGGSVNIAGQFGTLTIFSNGDYSYTRSEGGAPGAVTDVFNYTLTDGDGDTSTTTLTIAINDSGTSIDAPDQGEAGTVVDEQGLPERDGNLPDEPAGTGEAADGNGADNDDTSEATSAVISFTAPDGLGSVTIDGVAVTGVAGQTFAGAHGTLTITSFDAATGQIGYSYTLADNTSGDATFDDFAIVVTDSDGDSASDTLRVDIVDDTPLASADTDTVPAGQFGPALGNVITDAEGDGGEDNVGADDAVVTGVAAGDTGANLDNPATVGAVVQGSFGKLTLNTDGSYSYVRDQGTDGGVQDVFTYTLKDGDGDLVSTTLTITIDDSPVTIDAPDEGEGGTVVNEKGLPERDGDLPDEPAGTGEIADGDGTDNDDTSESTTGVINFTAPDGPAIIRIDGTVVTGVVGQTFDGAHGVLTITSYNAATGQIGYSYTLGDNTSGDATSDDFAIQVEDQDGDIANDTLVIDIIDDAPIANDDSNSVAEGGSVDGNVLPNDISGADDYDATGAVVGGVAGDDDSVDATNMVGGQIVIPGTWGTLTLNEDGSYTYVANGDTNPPQGTVDEFVYTIRDGDGDLDSAVLTINVEDVTILATDDEAIVDEAGLPTGSDPAADSETDADGEITVSGGTGPYSFTLDSPANGAFGTLTLNPDGTYSYTLTSRFDTNPAANNGTNVEDNRDSFNYTVTDAEGNTTTGTIFVDIVDDVPSVLVGGDTSVVEGQTADGTWSQVIGADQPGATTVVVFGGSEFALGVGINTGKGTLTVNADGTWTFQAANNLDNDLAQSIGFSVKVTDGDGDIAEDPHTITIDDGPPPTNSGPITLEVDDDALPSGNNSASPDEVDSGVITFTAGSDALTVEFSDDLSSLDPSLTWVRVNDTTIEGRDGGNLVVTLSLSGSLSIAAGANGNVTVTATLADNFDSHPTFTADDLKDLGTVGVVASDQDGDSTTANVNVDVSDDVPDNDVAGPIAVVEGQSINGTWSAAVGADQPGHSTVVTFGGTDFALGTPINTGKGTLTVNADGTWTFQAVNNLDNDVAQSISFTLKTTDADNDVATDPHTITINDGPPPTNSGPITLEVDDDALPSGNNSASPDEVDSGVITFTAGSDALTVEFSDDLSSLDPSLTWVRVNDTTIEGRDGGNLVVTLSLSGSLSIAAGANGNVTVTATLADNFDSHPTFTADDLKDLGTVGVVASDQDGDSTTANVNVDVSDDVPDNDVAGPIAVVEGQSINGTWSAAVGADQPGHSTVVTFGGTDFALGTPINTGKGTLTVNADGTWTFQAVNNLDNDVAQSISFTLKTTDADNDVATDPHTITINDGPPPTGGDTLDLLVDDEALPDGTNAASNDEQDSGTLSFTAGSDALTSFAFSNSLASLGGGLTWTRVNDTTIEGWDGPVGTGTKIVTLSLSAPASIAAGASGDVTVNVTLHNNYDSHPTINVDDLQDLGSVQVVASDHDGDSATGTVNLDVSDDTPVITSVTDPLEIENTGTTPSGTGDFAFNVGADQNADFDDISVSGFTITINGEPATNVVLTPNVDGSGNPAPETATTASYRFTFQYDTGTGGLANGIGTLVFNKATGEYTVALTSGPISGFTIADLAGVDAGDFVGHDAPGQGGGSDEIVVAPFADDLFVQFTGEARPANASTLLQTEDYEEINPPPAPDGDPNNAFVAGELFTDNVASMPSVTVSSADAGVNGNTIQTGEVIDFNLYETDPGATLGLAPTASASDMFIVFDNFDPGDDLIVVLKLMDPDTGVFTTKAVIVNQGDYYMEGSEALLAGTPYAPIINDASFGNNDSLLIIESNDYNTAPGENWVIVGAQVTNNHDGVTGSGINLNRGLGAGGASSGTEAFSTDTDVSNLKISNIGFIRESTTDQSATIEFDVTIEDADGDQVVRQDVTVQIGDPPAATLAAESSFSSQSFSKTAANDDFSSLLAGDGGHKWNGNGFGNVGNTGVTSAMVAASGLAAMSMTSLNSFSQPSFDSLVQDGFQQLSTQIAGRDNMDEGLASISLGNDLGGAMANTVNLSNSGFSFEDHGFRGGSLDAISVGDAEPAYAPSYASGEPTVGNIPAFAANVPSVSMASAEMLRGISLDANIQQSGAIEQVLAEALGNGAPTLDGVLANLPGGIAELAAIANLASPNGAGVPAWDMMGPGAFGPAPDVLFKVEAVMIHQDAVQPA